MRISEEAAFFIMDVMAYTLKNILFKEEEFDENAIKIVEETTRDLFCEFCDDRGITRVRVEEED